MEEAVDIIERAWREAPLNYDGRFHKVHIPAIRPKPVQQPGPPLWRSVISPGSFKECGRLGVPILTARLPVERIKERWATYEAGIAEGGHDDRTRARLLAQSALWRNVYVAESDAQAEDELAGLLTETRAHMCNTRRSVAPAATSSIGFSVETPVFRMIKRRAPWLRRFPKSSASRDLKVPADKCWLPANDVKAG